MLAEGDPAAAAQIYAEVLAVDATNIAALAGLAKCYVTTGAIEQAKQTLAMVPESKRNDAAVKAVQAAIDLAEQAKAVGPVTELEQKVAANPLDHQARFDLATALNAQGKRAEATDQLLEIVKRDRKWNDDGARKQLVQFFEAWGGADRGDRRWTKAAVDDFVLVARIPQKWEPVLRLEYAPKLTRLAPGPQMPINAEYRGPGELPEIIPVFPLPGALLLPRGQMPLNIFEPRYLAMVDDALRDGHRLIGMIQPDVSHSQGRGQADAVSRRLRRPHHPARRIRRRPLHPRTHRRRALQGGRGNDGADRVPAMQGGLLSLSPTISSRARARRPSTARRCSRC